MAVASKVRKNLGTKIPSFTQFLWENTHEIIILLSKKLIITDINPAAQAYFSVDKDTIKNRSIASLFLPKQINTLQQSLLRSNIVQLTFKSKKTLTCTFHPLSNAKQHVIGYVFKGNPKETMEELRVRVRFAERRYEDTYKLLQNIIDSAPGLIYWKDREGHYLGVNKFWCDTLKVNSSEVIGKKDEAFWPQQAKQLRKNDQKVMALGKTLIVEENTFFNKELGEVVFISFKSPLRDTENNIIGIIGTSLDITELKQTQRELIIAKEKAESANSAKANFMATISHEIRTPMNAILGMAQILSNNNLSPEQQGCVDIIKTSGKNLLELINDILDYSKLEAHKLEIKPEPFDLVKLIHETHDTIQYKAVEKHISLIIEYQGKMPARVIGDQMRIRQILLNLLSNALKFTEKGHIKIIVQAKPKKELILFKITIADTGIGIAKKHQSMVFDRFAQVDSPYNRRFQGTGLGLAIVKSLVEAMHGKIGLESEPRQGSRFWFTLPLRPFEEIIPQVVNKPVEESPVVFTRNYTPRILIVEDNILNQKVIQFMLKESGCQIDMANQGKMALELFKNNRYDLIFMDIGLPGMSGLEVTQAIRKFENKKHRHIPIIALTAHVGEEDFNHCSAAGADEVLTKPVIREELLKTLDHYCPEKD